MIKKYQKEDKISYTIGVYPTLELFKYKPDQIREVIYSSKGERNTGLTQIKNLAQEKHLPLAQNDKLVDQLSESENAYAIGVFNKYTSPIKSGVNHVVLMGIRDMGNLGTIIRSLVAFEVVNLAIIRPAADIFHPKVVRAAMGELFQINFNYFENFSDYQKQFTNQLYPLMTNGTANLETTTLISPYSLIFGSEAEGLPDNFLELGTSLKIRQSKNVDSLNLATAVGIVLHHQFS